jgi:6-phosphogluconolactonase (cycloisomerase 2 family)
LCGCGGGSTEILYAVGLGSPVVATFSVSGSGQITAIGSVSTGSAPDVIAIDPLSRFAYILDSAGNGGVAGGVSQYVLARKTGVLTIATFSSTNGTAPAATPVETGVNPRAMVVDNSGSFVFVANQGAVDAAVPGCETNSFCPSISVFSIDQVGGTLVEIKQLAPGASPLCIANQPTPCPLPVTGAATALATTGTMLFVGTTSGGAGSISTYNFNSGTPPSPATCPKDPGCLQTPAASTFIAAGFNPGAMALDPTGKFLFVADSVANTVTAFSIGGSGQLTSVGSAPTGTTPVSVHVHPSGKFLYTANQGSNDVSAFSIDSSGAVTALSGSPFSVQGGPSYVTTDTSGGFLFVAQRDANNIAVFSVASSGALKQVTGSPGPIPVIKPVALASN